MPKLFYIGLIFAGITYFIGKSYFEFPKDDLSGIYVAETCHSKENLYVLGDVFPCIFKLNKRGSSENSYDLVTYFTTNTTNYFFLAHRDWQGHYIYLWDDLSKFRFYLSKDQPRTLQNGGIIYHQYPLYNSVIEADQVASIPTWRYRLAGHWRVVGTDIDYYFSLPNSRNARSMDESDFVAMDRNSRGVTKLMQNHYKVTEEYSIERHIKGTYMMLDIQDAPLPFEAVFSKDGNEIQMTDYKLNKTPSKKYTLKRVSDCPRPNDWSVESCKKEYRHQTFI